MTAILKFWMDVILLLTFQYGVRPGARLDGSAERFNGPWDEANPYSERSSRSADF